MARAHEIAEVVTYLALDSPDHVNGADIGRWFNNVVKAWVIGAGITFKCRSQFSSRIPVTIFSNQRLGGLAGYVEKFDRHLDLGPHIFHSPDPEIVSYLNKSFPGEFHERCHWAKNYKAGKLYDYPISEEFIASLPAKTRDSIQNELKERSDLPSTNTETYAEYVEHLAGPTLTELFFTTYPFKLWGVPTSELDANWAPKRVTIKERSPFYGGQWAAVGKNGTSSIIQSLERQCVEQKVAIFKTKQSLEFMQSTALSAK